MDNFIINTRIMFEELPFNEWITYPSIPSFCFQAFYRYIDEPKLRPGVMVFENVEYTHFKKVKDERENS